MFHLSQLTACSTHLRVQLVPLIRVFRLEYSPISSDWSTRPYLETWALAHIFSLEHSPISTSSGCLIQPTGCSVYSYQPDTSDTRWVTRLPHSLECSVYFYQPDTSDTHRVIRLPHSLECSVYSYQPNTSDTRPSLHSVYFMPVF